VGSSRRGPSPVKQPHKHSIHRGAGPIPCSPRCRPKAASSAPPLRNLPGVWWFAALSIATIHPVGISSPVRRRAGSFRPTPPEVAMSDRTAPRWSESTAIGSDWLQAVPRGRRTERKCLEKKPAGNRRWQGDHALSHGHHRIGGERTTGFEKHRARPRSWRSCILVVGPSPWS